MRADSEARAAAFDPASSAAYMSEFLTTLELTRVVCEEDLHISVLHEALPEDWHILYYSAR